MRLPNSKKGFTTVPLVLGVFALLVTSALITSRIAKQNTLIPFNTSAQNACNQPCNDASLGASTCPQGYSCIKKECPKGGDCPDGEERICRKTICPNDKSCGCTTPQPTPSYPNDSYVQGKIVIKNFEVIERVKRLTGKDVYFKVRLAQEDELRQVFSTTFVKVEGKTTAYRIEDIKETQFRITVDHILYDEEQEKFKINNTLFSAISPKTTYCQGEGGLSCSIDLLRYDARLANFEIEFDERDESLNYLTIVYDIEAIPVPNRYFKFEACPRNSETKKYECNGVYSKFLKAASKYLDYISFEDVPEGSYQVTFHPYYYDEKGNQLESFAHKLSSKNNCYNDVNNRFTTTCIVDFYKGGGDANVDFKIKVTDDSKSAFIFSYYSYDFVEPNKEYLQLEICENVAYDQNPECDDSRRTILIPISNNSVSQPIYPVTAGRTLVKISPYYVDKNGEKIRDFDEYHGVRCSQEILDRFTCLLHVSSADDFDPDNNYLKLIVNNRRKNSPGTVSYGAEAPDYFGFARRQRIKNGSGLGIAYQYYSIFDLCPIPEDGDTPECDKAQSEISPFYGGLRSFRSDTQILLVAGQFELWPGKWYIKMRPAIYDISLQPYISLDRESEVTVACGGTETVHRGDDYVGCQVEGTSETLALSSRFIVDRIAVSHPIQGTMTITNNSEHEIQKVDISTCQHTILCFLANDNTLNSVTHIGTEGNVSTYGFKLAITDPSDGLIRRGQKIDLKGIVYLKGEKGFIESEPITITAPDPEVTISLTIGEVQPTPSPEASQEKPKRNVALIIHNPFIRKINSDLYSAFEKTEEMAMDIAKGHIMRINRPNNPVEYVLDPNNSHVMNYIPPVFGDDDPDFSSEQYEEALLECARWVSGSNRSCQYVQSYQLDYERLFEEYDICEKVNSGELDEVYQVVWPYVGAGEADMVGPNPFNINGLRQKFDACKRNVPIMTFDITRTIDGGAHTFVHRIEGTMSWVYGSIDTWAVPPRNNWERFVLSDGKGADKHEYSACGNAHFGPNSPTADYVYDSTNITNSICDNFSLYPNVSEVTKEISCSIESGGWGCNGDEFYGWWLDHLPANPGRGPDGKLNNWWKYINDPDLAYAESSVPKVESMDINNDDVVNLADFVDLVDNLGETPDITDGIARGDANNDGNINAIDVSTFYGFAGYELEGEAPHVHIGSLENKQPLFREVEQN